MAQTKRKKRHKKETCKTPANCPTGKPAYKTKRLAEEKMWRTIHGGRHGGFLPIRVYKCECGYWHMTHKPKRVGQK